MEAETTNDDVNAGNNNDNEEEDVRMDAVDTDDVEEDVQTEVDEIEDFPDDRPRATHSYKNDFPEQNANEYEVTKWIPIRISFKKPDQSNSNETNQVHPYMVKLASMINNTPKLNNK